jgi:hypothetical protein
VSLNGERMNPFLSPPGMIFLALAIVGLIWVMGKLFGVSFVFIGSLVIGFLIVLISYLVMHLCNEPLLEKLRRFFTQPKN